jgi:hypothetical protein
MRSKSQQRPSTQSCLHLDNEKWGKMLDTKTCKTCACKVDEKCIHDHLKSELHQQNLNKNLDFYA